MFNTSSAHSYILIHVASDVFYYMCAVALGLVLSIRHCTVQGFFSQLTDCSHERICSRCCS
uniref:Uncharacterized protein n=1 Tax=Anguilla anguilla TaxID=7936 RepID=A0A0E9UBG6_ANGAN